MGRLQSTYLQYGVPSDLAAAFEKLDLSATTFRATSIKNLVEKYGVQQEVAEWVKKCLVRAPISDEVIQQLLESSNFVCCCCKGTKSDHYIIHHITPYEVSQDNSYANLAVLCPNDHDLAHSQSGLTLRLTADQIRECKQRWEDQVRLNNLAVSLKDREQLISQIPRYQRLNAELNEVRLRLAEKEKLLGRSESLFEYESNAYRKRIEDLEGEKKQLEEQVQSIAARLSLVDLSKASKLYLDAVSLFLKGDIAAAITILDEDALDAELAKAEKLRQEANDSICRNADGRLLRAELLTLDGRFAEARQSADASLKLYQSLADSDVSKYGAALAWGLETVGSIQFAAGEYAHALSTNERGLEYTKQFDQGAGEPYLPLQAVFLQNIGTCHFKLGSPEQALQCLESAVVIFSVIRKVHARLGISAAFIDLRHVAALTNLGIAYAKQGQHNESLRPLLVAQRLLDAMTDKESRVYRNSLAINLIAFADSLWKLNDPTTASETYERLVPVMKSLVRQDNLDEQLALGTMLRNLSKTCYEAQRDTEAVQYCEDTIRHYGNLVSVAPEVSEMNMAAAHLCRSFLFTVDASNHQRAAESASQAKALAERHPGNPESPSIIENAAQVLDHLRKVAVKPDSDSGP